MSATRHPSCREPEIDDVSVLNDVLLAFETDFAVLTTCGHRTARNEGVIRHDFGANESPRNIAVNFARRHLRRGMTRDRPGAALVFAHREKGNVSKQIVGGANDPIETRLGQAKV